MNSTHPLSGSHLRTYETIFQHPVSHNLDWREVHALFKHLGEIEDMHNGNLKVTRNGKTLVLHRQMTKDVADADEVMALRHFLKSSETMPAPRPAEGALWLLVIDHHEARVMRCDIQGGSPGRIVPDGFFRHTRDSGNFSRGREKPDPNGYFKPVAEALKAPGRILVLGTGTGMSSEMDQFIGWLNRHQPDLAARVIGSLTVDEKHLTSDQLLAKAREFYAIATTA